MIFSKEQLVLYPLFSATTYDEAKKIAESTDNTQLITVTNDPNSKLNGNYQYSKSNGIIKLGGCGCKK